MNADTRAKVLALCEAVDRLSDEREGEDGTAELRWLSDNLRAAIDAWKETTDD